MRTLSLLLIVLLSFCCSSLQAKDEAYLLMFRPVSVDSYSDMPEDLAKAYPNHTMIVVTFKPVTHPAEKDGSNLKEGEGSWLDRGMRPNEPGKIRFLVSDEDMLQHTLRVSEGPFVFKVKNTGKGYFETVPIVSPKFETVLIPSSKTVAFQSPR